jgi:hypothetical protein
MQGVSVHLIDSIGDFLEAAVHQVLFGKKVSAWPSFQAHFILLVTLHA